LIVKAFNPLEDILLRNLHLRPKKGEDGEKPGKNLPLDPSDLVKKGEGEACLNKKTKGETPWGSGHR
jgi:hypothetical protein